MWCLMVEFSSNFWLVERLGSHRGHKTLILNFNLVLFYSCVNWGSSRSDLFQITQQPWQHKLAAASVKLGLVRFEGHCWGRRWMASIWSTDCSSGVDYVSMCPQQFPSLKSSPMLCNLTFWGKNRMGSKSQPFGIWLEITRSPSTISPGGHMSLLQKKTLCFLWVSW